MVKVMSYPTCKYRAVARVVMVGGLGSGCCTCSFVLALVCCVSGYIDSSSTLSLTGAEEEGHAATEDAKEVPAATG